MAHEIVTRPETAADHDAIENVVRSAFGRQSEARLVAALRALADFDPELSLVAVAGGTVVGHILFTPVSVLRAGESPVAALALAPLAVLPGLQRRGIGSVLVRDGLQACRQRGHELVIVVGHPSYYPRFGFVPARARGLEVPFAVRDEAFMLCELGGKSASARPHVRGMVQYPAPFLAV